MYELFVLGGLMDSPMHGYLRRDIVNLAIGPVRQMSWGALYPLMRGLEKEGLVEQVSDEKESSEKGSSARARKVYRITESGQARFFYLMLKRDDYSADYPDLFNIKLVNFDQLAIDQQGEILRHYRGYLQFVIDHHREREEMIVGNPEISPNERHWIGRVIAHRLAVAESDLAWINAEITTTENCAST